MWQMVTGAATVTVNATEAVLPALSIAVQVTVVVPTGNREPDCGSQLTSTEVSTLSVAVGVGYVTVVPELQVASTLIGAGTFDIVGGIMSTTLTVTVAVAVAVPSDIV
jgi:hypothetical protein